MCGFTGRINFNLQQNINEALLRKANQAISHRGPDDDGIYLKQNVGPIAVCRLLIFRHLAINQ